MHNHFLWGIADDGRGLPFVSDLGVSLYVRSLDLHENIQEELKSLDPHVEVMLVMEKITREDLPLLKNLFSLYKEVRYWIIGKHGRECDSEQADVYAQAILTLKEVIPEAIIGASITYTPAFALTYHIEHELAKQNFDYLNNYRWIDVIVKGRLKGAKNEALLKEAAKCIAFLAVDYRISVTVIYQPFKNVKYSYRVDEGHHQNFDLGLYYLCRDLSFRYDLPLLIFEKRLDHDPDSIHDPYRKDMLRESIKQVKEAKKDECDIMGYVFEPLVDDGHHQGLIRQDLTHKESFAYYKEMIKGDE
jgi:beta-glucosidase/6-phospho-beta-glucosidase/beta-galactosidase